MNERSVKRLAKKKKKKKKKKATFSPYRLDPRAPLNSCRRRGANASDYPRANQLASERTRRRHFYPQKWKSGSGRSPSPVKQRPPPQKQHARDNARKHDSWLSRSASSSMSTNAT